MNKTFSAEVKAAACARVLAGERPTAVARDVGCHVTTLRGWMSASGHAAPAHGRAPNGQILPGYTPNPGGSTTHIERAQRLLEEAAPREVERLLRLIDRIDKAQDPKEVEVEVAKGHVIHKLANQLLDAPAVIAADPVTVKRLRRIRRARSR